MLSMVLMRLRQLCRLGIKELGGGEWVQSGLASARESVRRRVRRQFEESMFKRLYFDLGDLTIVS